MLTREIQRGDLFTVSSWREKIAVEWQRFTLEYPEYEDLLICEDDSCDHASEICWLITDVREEEPVENPTYSIVRLVGDDRLHEVLTDDLIPVRYEQVCSCGQINGCWSAEEEI
jgi:hypothetical protein